MSGLPTFPSRVHRSSATPARAARAAVAHAPRRTMPGLPTFPTRAQAAATASVAHAQLVSVPAALANVHHALRKLEWALKYNGRYHGGDENESARTLRYNKRTVTRERVMQARGDLELRFIFEVAHTDAQRNILTTAPSYKSNKVHKGKRVTPHTHEGAQEHYIQMQEHIATVSVRALKAAGLVFDKDGGGLVFKSGPFGDIVYNTGGINWDDECDRTPAVLASSSLWELVQCEAIWAAWQLFIYHGEERGVPFMMRILVDDPVDPDAQPLDVTRVPAGARSVSSRFTPLPINSLAPMIAALEDANADDVRVVPAPARCVLMMLVVHYDRMAWWWKYVSEEQHCALGDCSGPGFEAYFRLLVWELGNGDVVSGCTAAELDAHDGDVSACTMTPFSNSARTSARRKRMVFAGKHGFIAAAVSTSGAVWTCPPYDGTLDFAVLPIHVGQWSVDADASAYAIDELGAPLSALCHESTNGRCYPVLYYMVQHGHVCALRTTTNHVTSMCKRKLADEGRLSDRDLSALRIADADQDELIRASLPAVAAATLRRTNRDTRDAIARIVASIESEQQDDDDAEEASDEATEAEAHNLRHKAFAVTITANPTKSSAPDSVFVSSIGDVLLPTFDIGVGGGGDESVRNFEAAATMSVITNAAPVDIVVAAARQGHVLEMRIKECEVVDAATWLAFPPEQHERSVTLHEARKAAAAAAAATPAATTPAPAAAAAASDVVVSEGGTIGGSGEGVMEGEWVMFAEPPSVNARDAADVDAAASRAGKPVARRGRPPKVVAVPADAGKRGRGRPPKAAAPPPALAALATAPIVVPPPPPAAPPHVSRQHTRKLVFKANDTPRFETVQMFRDAAEHSLFTALQNQLSALTVQRSNGISAYPGDLLLDTTAPTACGTRYAWTRLILPPQVSRRPNYALRVGTALWLLDDVLAYTARILLVMDPDGWYGGKMGVFSSDDRLRAYDGGFDRWSWYFVRNVDGVLPAPYTDTLWDLLDSDGAWVPAHMLEVLRSVSHFIDHWEVSLQCQPSRVVDVSDAHAKIKQILASELTRDKKKAMICQLVGLLNKITKTQEKTHGAFFVKEQADALRSSLRADLDVQQERIHAEYESAVQACAATKQAAAQPAATDADVWRATVAARTLHAAEQALAQREATHVEVRTLSIAVSPTVTLYVVHSQAKCQLSGGTRPFGMLVFAEQRIANFQKHEWAMRACTNAQLDGRRTDGDWYSLPEAVQLATAEPTDLWAGGPRICTDKSKLRPGDIHAERIDESVVMGPRRVAPTGTKGPSYVPPSPPTFRSTIAPLDDEDPEAVQVTITLKSDEMDRTASAKETASLILRSPRLIVEGIVPGTAKTSLMLEVAKLLSARFDWPPEAVLVVVHTRALVADICDRGGIATTVCDFLGQRIGEDRGLQSGGKQYSMAGIKMVIRDEIRAVSDSANAAVSARLDAYPEVIEVGVGDGQQLPEVGSTLRWAENGVSPSRLLHRRHGDAAVAARYPTRLMLMVPKRLRDVEDHPFMMMMKDLIFSDPNDFSEKTRDELLRRMCVPVAGWAQYSELLDLHGADGVVGMVARHHTRRLGTEHHRGWEEKRLRAQERQYGEPSPSAAYVMTPRVGELLVAYPPQFLDLRDSQGKKKRVYKSTNWRVVKVRTYADVLKQREEAAEADKEEARTARDAMRASSDADDDDVADATRLLRNASSRASGAKRRVLAAADPAAVAPKRASLDPATPYYDLIEDKGVNEEGVRVLGVRVNTVSQMILQGNWTFPYFRTVWAWQGRTTPAISVLFNCFGPYIRDPAYWYVAVSRGIQLGFKPGGEDRRLRYFDDRASAVVDLAADFKAARARMRGYRQQDQNKQCLEKERAYHTPQEYLDMEAAQQWLCIDHAECGNDIHVRGEGVHQSSLDRRTNGPTSHARNNIRGLVCQTCQSARHQDAPAAGVVMEVPATTTSSSNWQRAAAAEAVDRARAVQARERAEEERAATGAAAEAIEGHARAADAEAKRLQHLRDSRTRLESSGAWWYPWSREDTPRRPCTDASVGAAYCEMTRVAALVNDQLRRAITPPDQHIKLLQTSTATILEASRDKSAYEFPREAAAARACQIWLQARGSVCDVDDLCPAEEMPTDRAPADESVWTTLFGSAGSAEPIALPTFDAEGFAARMAARRADTHTSSTYEVEEVDDVDY